MRETRLSGSEGGGIEFNRFSLPLSRACRNHPGAGAPPLLNQGFLPFQRHAVIHEIHWGQAVLTPGNYSFRLHSSGAHPDYTVLVREEDQTKTIIFPDAGWRRRQNSNVCACLQTWVSGIDLTREPV
jgi:hypothetical protein